MSLINVNLEAHGGGSLRGKRVAVLLRDEHSELKNWILELDDARGTMRELQDTLFSLIAPPTSGPDVILTRDFTPPPLFATVCHVCHETVFLQFLACACPGEKWVLCSCGASRSSVQRCRCLYTIAEADAAAEHVRSASA